MQVVNYHSSIFRSVSATYSLDSDVQLNATADIIVDGYGINFINALSGLQDTSSNNYNNLYLTEPKRVDDVLQIKREVPAYPKFRSTWIKNGDTYWVVNASTGALSVSGTDVDLDNRYFFELEIIDPQWLAVRHYDGTAMTYLTLTKSNSAVGLTFSERDVANNPAGGPAPTFDSQLFQYILDEDSNILTLMSLISTGLSDQPLGQAIEPVVLAREIDIIKGKPITDTVYGLYAGFTTLNQFNIRPQTSAPSVLNLQNTWCSYVSSVGGDTSLNVNASNSYSDIQNNYLTSTATNELSTTMSVNLLPLKNQLTIDSGISKSNPYFETENETTHRLYHRLHTGTHQEFGDDSISLNYSSGVKELTFPAGSVTYFHVPSNIAPYKRLNINDSTLLKSGAVANSSPMQSDKVYKHRSNDYNMTSIVDQVDGTWVCAWLSGNSDPVSTPIWVDRFFNPNFITEEEALVDTSATVQYVDKFETVTTNLSAQSLYVFDVLSDLVFEPNALYAYHHVGNKENQQVVDTLSNNQLFDGNALNYKDSYDITADPEYIEDGSTHTMSDDGKMMTEAVHGSKSMYVPPTYSFNGSNYGTTPVIRHNGSFTINFWMYNDDWTTSFADQLIGNFTTHGFGIYNEPFVTPIIIAPDNDKVHIYNSEYKNIDTHLINKTIKHIVRKGSIDNYWIIDGNNHIYEYDMTGVVQNKITSSHLTGKTIYDLEVDNDYIYAITGVEGNSARYFKYDLKNQSTSYVGESQSVDVWNYDTSYVAAGSALRIHSVKQGLSAAAGVLVTAPDNYLSQGSVIDNNGVPWAIQNNYLYTYDTTISANIIGLSASGTQTLEAVNCDRDNNIWLLYGDNKVVKFDTNRNITFTATLTSTPYSSTRYIDFIYEFTSTGYDNRVTILNQSLSGCKAISINSTTGRDETGQALLTGDNPVTFFATPMSACKTITGFDYLRNHQLVTRPRLEAKLSLTNLYNSSTTTAAFSGYTLSSDLSSLNPGWHNICVVLDAEHGLYNMYIDAALVDAIELPSAKFSFSDIFTRPLTIGASPFDITKTLASYLNQSKHYYAQNTKINRLYLYDKPLDYSYIMSHYRTNNRIRDMKWPIPTGERNFVDTVERVFKHRLPGRKSELYNINITGIDIANSAVKDDIQAQIIDELNKVTPVHTKLNKVVWGNDRDIDNNVSSDTTINVVAPKNSSSSTTSTGGGYGS